MLYRSDGRGYSEPNRNNRAIIIIAIIVGLAILAGVTVLVIKGYRNKNRVPEESAEEISEISSEISSDRKSTRLNSSHTDSSRMPSSA